MTTPALGTKARCKVTGFIGTVTVRAEYLHGTVRAEYLHGHDQVELTSLVNGKVVSVWLPAASTEGVDDPAA